MSATGQPACHVDPNKLDDVVVSEICDYLTGSPPRSFFLFAGAGSGKTRTLIHVLRRLTGLEPDDPVGQEFACALRRGARSIGVITFTNNACDEVRDRLGINPLVSVSTIHSFAWELIHGFDDDIRAGLVERVESKIEEIEQKHRNSSRKPTKASLKKLGRLQDKRCELDDIRRFSYSPNNTRFGGGVLDHSEVIWLAASLLGTRETLRNILIDRHPVLLIDESQDTQKAMMTSLVEVEQVTDERFVLGLIGDHRQRIYLDGEPDLARNVPEDWATPRLRMNHRSDRRIVELINRVWEAQLEGRTQSGKDDQQQPRSERTGGFVRLFLGGGSQEDKPARERWCADQMADQTGDATWTNHGEGYKSLVLEHRMAAVRGGFEAFWTALHGYRNYQERLKEGDLPVLTVFRDRITPLLAAVRDDGSPNEHAVMALLMKQSPLLLPKEASLLTPTDQISHLQQVEDAVVGVRALWRNEADPKLGAEVQELRGGGLFDLHEDLLQWSDHEADPDAKDPEPKEDPKLAALVTAMETPWSEYAAYQRYIRDAAAFATHQGVKGSEYPRVLLVLDDGDAVGHLFSYDKLFKAKELSQADEKNIEIGKETTIDRTLRLFYVACSRARDSLAVVLWTLDTDKAMQQAVESGWFTEDEILLIPPA